LPGVEKADLSVQVAAGMLEIGARRRGIAVDGFRPVYVETTPVRFARVIPLPPTVKTDVARATLDRGLLTVRLAKESVAPRRSVPVEVT
jgi:HSP20 family molecular chaperone IbpA